jgi:hypothetical protein
MLPTFYTKLGTEQHIDTVFIKTKLKMLPKMTFYQDLPIPHEALFYW